MEVKCTLQTIAFEDLSKQDQELLNAAKQAASKAFAPYSGFRVGAAARMSNGEIVIGSNQENIAYPSGLCGERVALFSAGAQFPNEEVVTLATVSPSDIADPHGFAPCGSCRQVILESEIRQLNPIRLLFQVKDDVVLISDSAENLMPFSFRVKDDGLKRIKG